jgi:cytochrome c
MFAATAGHLVTRPAHAQNAENGRTLFRQICGICHDATAGRNRVGPSLFSLVGRKTGSVEGYHYSDANKNAGIIWDETTLDRYIRDPRSVVPGTFMAYAGLTDDQKRHDLIAYLATLH